MGLLGWPSPCHGVQTIGFEFQIDRWAVIGQHYQNPTLENVKLKWWRSSAALECSPVTGEVAGSSPVVTAKVLIIFFINYNMGHGTARVGHFICNEEVR